MTKYLKASLAGRPIGVDRDARILRGYVIAQEGAFKTEGRGEFDKTSLRQIVQLAAAGPPAGLKSRWTHPDSSNDGLGKFLGRVRGVHLSTATAATGEQVPAVRGDLHFSPTASKTPSGDLAGYILDLAEEDPDAISSSLVLTADEEWRLNKDGTARSDERGDPLPPLWRVTSLHASDIVDTGDAVDGLLGAQLTAQGLPDAVVRQAAGLLRAQFEGRDRAFVQARLSAWCLRVLDHYWPADDDSDCDLRRWLATLK